MSKIFFKKKNSNIIALFEGIEIRVGIFDGLKYYVVNDVIKILSETKNTKDYIKRMRKSDDELREKWFKLVIRLPLMTGNGRQDINCANKKSLLRILQAIPKAKKKVEPFKVWLNQIENEKLGSIKTIK